MRIEELLKLATVIPVVEIDDADDAGPLAAALAEGGLKVVELTLRTPAAVPALAKMKRAASLIVGMGTILHPADIQKSLDAGADFLVSPGSTPALLHALAGSGAPSLPGIATASEAMAAAERGFTALKFFPAEASGGADYLSALAGPLPSIIFCPTGGIGAERAGAYLRLANVACVGGSWIASRNLIRAKAWETIAVNARHAAALRRP